MIQTDKKLIWIDRCDRAMVFCLCAVIYFLPISTALIQSFVGTAILFYVVKRVLLKFSQKDDKNINPVWAWIKAFLPKPNYLNRPLGIFLATVLVTIIFSQYPSISIKAFFTKLLDGCFTFFIVVECITNEKRLRWFFLAFMCSVLLTSINGLVQYFHGEGFVHGYAMTFDRVSSCFKHPNALGAYLIIVVLLLFGVLLRWFSVLGKNGHAVKETHKIKVFSWSFQLIILALFVLAGINLGLCLSRGAWLGFLCGIIFIGLQNKRFLFFSICIISVFFFVFYSQLTSTRKVSFFTDDMKAAARITNEDDSKITKLLKQMSYLTGAGRKEYWQEAMGIIKDYPVFGTGFSTYSKFAPHYKINWGGYPHNSYLHMTAEIGIFGFLTFLWFVISIFRQGIRRMKNLKGKYLPLAINWGILAGLFGFYIHTIFDNMLYSVKLVTLMWLMIGILISVFKIYDADLAQEAEK